MESTSTFTDDKAIKQIAARWASKMAAGMPAEEKQQLVAWINADKAHHKAITKITHKHNNTFMLDELSGVFPLEKERKLKPYHISYSILLICLIAAVLTSISIIISGDKKEPTHPTYSQSFKTVIGEQATYALPDGSKIKLNTNSFVKVDYSDRHRSLTLLNGEANFNVAQNVDRPFTVNVGEQAFTALGTVFNIYKENNEDMKVIVSQGQVLLSTSAAILAALNYDYKSPLPLSELPGVIVNEGQEADITNNIVSQSRQLTDEELQQKTAWQQGILIFDGDRLVDALKEISRYNNTHFEIASPQLADVKISGYFKAGDINGLLLALKDSFNIDYKKVSYHSIILSQAGLH